VHTMPKSPHSPRPQARRAPLLGDFPGMANGAKGQFGAHLRSVAFWPRGVAKKPGPLALFGHFGCAISRV